ncbi:MAG: 2-oxo acid dehydrogenase subunit E2 [Polyangiaceae bacterium]|nr:2-oxo acid dehydrogenase subunit E2 [Polyangiaceae bacterium]
MSNFEFKLPDIGEGVTEGEIVNWLIKEGDAVREDQEMVEVMTDKATVTIGAPKAGTVVRLGGKVGEIVPVGQVLVVLAVGGGAVAAAPPAAPAVPAAPTTPAPSTQKQDGPAATAVGDIREELPGMGAFAPKKPAAAQAPAGSNGGYFEEKPLAAPATRKLAREMGVDLRHVQPTGPASRVTREDVERYAVRGRTPAPVIHVPATEVSVHHAVTVVPQAEPASPKKPELVAPPRGAGDQRVPLRGLRKRIYENMARSKHTAAHFTYVDECDASALKALRERTKAFAERDGVKLTFLPFIVKAVVAALKRHPALNCLVDDAAGEMVLKGSYDIGVAAATESGLIVPVVRNADRLSIIEIAGELERLSADARNGKTRKEDLGGSSFTITSLGKLGGLFATPIVNYPEVAILGVHEMKRRPVVKGDQIVIGDVMLLSLSFDHRIIDGHVGAAFAQEIIGLLEEPERLLVSMA